MSKYVIELDKDVKSVQSIIVTPYGNVYTHTDGIANLEELNSDYINEHYGQLQDEAYQRGYKDCETRYCSFDACPNRQAEYKRGLEDAWECARELYLNGACKDLFGEYFNTFIKNHTAQEAIAKLKAYEEKQDDEIEVGDTVNLKDASLDKENGLVTKIWNNDYCYIVWSDGSSGSWEKNMLVKTGKHIDIASILEDMRND